MCAIKIYDHAERDSHFEKKKKSLILRFLSHLGASWADVRCRIRPRRGVQQVSEKKA